MKDIDVDVSVIICTYNSDITKLKKTIFSVITQKKLCLEIIISDDGSSYFNETEIHSFFSEKDFVNYKIYVSPTNLGTVKNIYMGVNNARGKYVYIISPGDLFYSEHTLFDLYCFCENNHCKFCFGDAINYESKDGEIVFTKSKFPKNPDIYIKTKFSYRIALIGFFAKQQPIGATYFRDRKEALHYFALIQDKIKYVEDYPSTAMFLLDNKKLLYCEKPVIWYEYGSGISTSGSKIWKERIGKDFAIARNMLLEMYPKNKIVIVKYPESKLIRLMHPLISICGILIELIGELKYRLKQEKLNTEFIMYVNQKYE